MLSETDRSKWRVVVGVSVLVFLGGLGYVLVESGVPTERRPSPDNDPRPSIDSSHMDGATPAAPSTPKTSDVLNIVDSEIVEQTTPPRLSDMTKIWDSEARELINIIAAEDFSEMLENSADFDANYYKMVNNYYSALPGLPYATEMIFLSRRFARLAGQMDRDKLEYVVQHLHDDIQKLKKLQADGQEFRGTMTISIPKDGDAADLLIPLSFRINVSLMLLGLTKSATALPDVLNAVDAQGKFSNLSASGYAVDRMLTGALESEATLSPGERDVLRRFEDWKRDLPVDHPFKEFKVVSIPAWDELRRPAERSFVMSGQLGDVAQVHMVTMEKPPVWQAFQLRDFDEKRSAFYDPSNFGSDALDLIDLGRAFVASR